jgi:hypothetical protein
MKSLYENSLYSLESWFETVRDREGYRGPAIGLRRSQLACCVPGYDWRYEGLLAGWIERHKASGDAFYLTRLKQDIAQIIGAQLGNGTFKNSHFTDGPFEGGMPHEPAMLNAAVKAAVYLEQNSLYNSSALKLCVGRYIDSYLIAYLWNKLLKTFNNWPFSEFEVYSPYCVASVIELLSNYGKWQNCLEVYLPYISFAGESIIKTQCTEGSSSGAFPTLSSGTKGYSPFYTARCLCSLKILEELCDDRDYKKSFDMAESYIRDSALKQGGFCRLTFQDRKPMTTPLLLGAVSGILDAFKRASCLKTSDLDQHMPLLMKEQSASGAFHTAVGFGKVSLPKEGARRDFRDFFPVCGWNDKIFYLLSALGGGAKPERNDFINDAHLAIVNGSVGNIKETPWEIKVLDKKNIEVYHWTKKENWPLKLAL